MSDFTRIAVETGASMLVTTAKLVIEALVAKGMTRDQARAELVEMVEELVETDKGLEERQAERLRRLNERIPPTEI